MPGQLPSVLAPPGRWRGGGRVEYSAPSPRGSRLIHRVDAAFLGNQWVVGLVNAVAGNFSANHTRASTSESSDLSNWSSSGQVRTTFTPGQTLLTGRYTQLSWCCLKPQVVGVRARFESNTARQQDVLVNTSA